MNPTCGYRYPTSQCSNRSVGAKYYIDRSGEIGEHHRCKNHTKTSDNVFETREAALAEACARRLE